ncbi:MAG: hypothetical protein AUK33_11135 [Flavobacteriaceae bacterium CG2_30_34_30]|nr:hypothetical protein [Flavobacteriales bacterium]OIP49189.1 MAG: hypothetical protein AUK33_11135 [Flavobacteriaceae bacterium CG2_30_34_30]PIQ18861.1 MAG: hypothetical protein COW66_04210 [Flavobacteriaceae bacterium CG18_big_fil_WC_8_21_14_2_50_34_36]PIV49787.1 MAG: hypothetical protein COS19_06825 [Flavobacteriaceae bacterium CG02_land_8_20_14_3_00_34_13]PIZ07008.1 MAG: hypothetical protein COY56_11230 [Flavobacteriaceae bacterium CG_4_10_14_0_8_um_filter_34_31]PJC06261.1 MAG: hypothetic
MKSIEKVTKALSDLFNKAKKPKFEIVEQIGNTNAFGQASAGFYQDGSLGEVYPIKIAHKTFKSWMQLGSTVGHELIHVIDFYGNYPIWRTRFGPDGAKARTEINAHRWQIQMSAPVNMPRYNSFINQVYVGSNLKPYGIN